jgi:predicted acyltransferase
MLLLISHGFGALQGHPVWGGLAAQLNHAPWDGASFWDFIMAAFLFMSGMALPFALERRRAQGAATLDLFRHVARRAVILILLSQVIVSVASGRLHFQLNNVLNQIALVNLCCFFILQMRFRLQLVAVALILAGYWALYVLFPGSAGPLSRGDNVGSRIDLALLGHNYSDDDVTITFVSSIANGMFGAWSALLLRKRRPWAHNVLVLSGGAAICLLLGLAMMPYHAWIQRLWTTSFALWSGGWVLVMLLAFYLLVEVAGFRKFTFPLVVLGSNSLFIYSVSILLHGWIDGAVAVFTGRFKFVGDLAPVAQAIAVVLVMWSLCYWLYKRRIFLKF